jgi:hypothetical protein
MLNLFCCRSFRILVCLESDYDEDDESNYEQEVDEAAANVTEQAKKPER